MKVVDGKVVCDRCSTVMVVGSGWYQCPLCDYRHYGNPDPSYGKPVECPRCSTKHRVDVKQCPTCGLDCSDN